MPGGIGGMVFRAEGVVDEVTPGKLRGQNIAKVRLDNGGYLTFDVISNIYKIDVGDRIVIEIHDSKPNNLDEYEFCGHGFLVDDEDKLGKTLLSIWGILFSFDNKLGLNINKKYYVCIRRK
jgi:DNA-directed RNA polymerase subunit G